MLLEARVLLVRFINQQLHGLHSLMLGEMLYTGNLGKYIQWFMFAVSMDSSWTEFALPFIRLTT